LAHPCLIADAPQVAYVAPSSFAWIYHRLGDVDNPFTWMDRAIDARDPMMIPIESFPFPAFLRSDLHFHTLLRKMNPLNDTG